MSGTATSDEFTVADLEAWASDRPDDGCRYELIGGSIVMSPSPTPRHQRASGRLYRLLDDACPTGHAAYLAPIDLDLAGEGRVVPDIVIAPDASVGELRLTLPVLLVVELISPSSVLHDRHAKRDVYAGAGIEHYWVLDTRPGHERFTAHHLGADGYDTVADHATRIDVTEPVPVAASLASLLDR